MKKLFLILVSVLVLGGCSVDDDISVSGGGVSSGGDDMVTTYPNVVEASRTVVEGGYLVDYYVNGLENNNIQDAFFMVFENIWKKTGIKNSPLYQDFVELFAKSLVSVKVNWLLGAGLEILDLTVVGHIYENGLSDPNSVLFSVGEHSGVDVYIQVGIGFIDDTDNLELKKIAQKGYSSSAFNDSHIFSCCFTLFEPSK